jgi:hypothetical protein
MVAHSVSPRQVGFDLRYDDFAALLEKEFALILAPVLDVKHEGNLRGIATRLALLAGKRARETGKLRERAVVLCEACGRNVGQPDTTG